MSIAERVSLVRDRIGRACERAGRDPASVTLVAAAKGQPPERVREAFEAGIEVVGENRVQEALQKIPMCPSGLCWHMIGHLQRNKVRAAVDRFEMIHSVDSLRLLSALNAACEAAGKVMPVLLEVNVSGEACKYGLPPAEVPGVLEQAGSLMCLNVEGLMTVPPFAPEPEAARPYFRRLREDRDRWRDETGFPLEALSMGMSLDFEVAVEEGATLVRVGSLLFGPRP
jgi:pyridoxal phosphate enzyme (YggS family)